ncbi:hypothetical protein V2W45_1336191 [Cenococcum geophilum]
MPTFVSDERTIRIIRDATQLSDSVQIPRFLRTQGFIIADFALVTRKTLQELIAYLKSQGFQIQLTDRRHSLISVLTEWIEGEWQKEAQEQARQARQAQLEARRLEEVRQQAYQAQIEAQRQEEIQQQEQARQALFLAQVKAQNQSWW